MDIGRIFELTKIRSKLTGREYKISDVVRLTDLIQSAAYIENGVAPVDIYLSKDNDGRPKIVFLFDKEESRDVYKKWRNHELEYTIHENDKACDR